MRLLYTVWTFYIPIIYTIGPYGIGAVRVKSERKAPIPEKQVEGLRLNVAARARELLYKVGSVEHLLGELQEPLRAQVRLHPAPCTLHPDPCTLHPAARTGWHLWEMDLRFAPGLPPG